MSTKAAYSPEDPTVKQTITIQSSLLESAKKLALAGNGGNLSRYIQTLIERGVSEDVASAHPLIYFVKKVAPTEEHRITDAMTWAPAEALAELKSEVEAAQMVVVEKVNLRAKAKNEEEYSEVFNDLLAALKARIWAQRKLRLASPLLNERELLADLAKSLSDYFQSVRQQAENDDGTRKSSPPRDPQFALRNPLTMETPEDRDAKDRQRPVIIPKGMYDDMRKQIEALKK